MNRFVITNVLCAAASLLGAGNVVLAEEAEQEGLHIEAQPLSSALREFSEQTGLQIGYAAELAEGKETAGVAGVDDPEVALDTLLAQSGLEHRFVNAETVVIRATATSFANEEGSSDSGNPRPTLSPVLIAQARTSVDQDQASRRTGTDSDRDEKKRPVEEIIVTGTHIRGVGVSVGSQIITLDREAIDQSGFATTQQLIRSLPQNFQGGVSEDATTGSFFHGSSINLRGLGNAATLTLINGRRMPVAGLGTNYVDISTIPSSAIEKIEVLPDGASAVYGSDAIAGVVNVILRNDFEGAETQLRVGSVTEGNLEEYRLAQTFGKVWGSGNGVLSYEYYKRGNLASADRDYLASQDLRPFGGDDFRSPFSNPGNILSLTGPPDFAIPEGQDGTNLTVGDLLPGEVNLTNFLEFSDVLGDQERHSLFVSGSQQLTDKVQLFTQARYTERDSSFQGAGEATFLTVPASNPFFVDPQGFGAVFVTYDLRDDLGLVVDKGTQKSWTAGFGGDVDLASDWQLEAFASFSREDADNERPQVDEDALNAALADPDPATAFNPFGDGSNTNPTTLTMLRTTRSVETSSKVSAFNLVADGSLMSLAGGEAKLAVGANYREEDFEKILSESLGFLGASGSSQFDRQVFAAFAELYFPLFSEANRRSGVERLFLSVAARYEDYRGISDASTTDPKVGLLWSPMRGLALRGTWGTSFRAPNLADLDTTANTISRFSLPDPTSAMRSNALVIQGGNPDLDNETADTWAIGLAFRPEAAPGFELDLNYFNIVFENRIAGASTFIVLPQENLFASRIIRNPTTAQIDALCDDPTVVSTPELCRAWNATVIVDARLRNEAETEVRGLDFTLADGFDTENLGRFDFRLNGTYLIDFKSAVTSNTPQFERIDSVGNPVDLRLRNSVRWSNYRGLSASAFVNYADSYTDDLSVPERKIDSWTTVDLTVSFNTDMHVSESNPLHDTQLSLSVLNLFDEDPPFVNKGAGGYDRANADPLGRFVSLNLTKKW